MIGCILRSHWLSAARSLTSLRSSSLRRSSLSSPVTLTNSSISVKSNVTQKMRFSSEDDIIDKYSLDAIEEEFSDFSGLPMSSSDQQNVLVVYLEAPKSRRRTPEIEHQEKKERQRTSLSVAEAISLVHSIPNWRVIDRIAVRMRPEFQLKTSFFKKMTLANLTMHVNSIRPDIVMIDAEKLSNQQIVTLSHLWNCHVTDRYMLVLAIFKLHANSKEAKLQIARVMISLIKSRLSSSGDALPWKPDANLKSVSRIRAKPGESRREVRNLRIHNIENKLKAELEKAKRTRDRTRELRSQSQTPVVSVVGYTNSGKTSIIRAMTHSGKLSPADRLFATTDSTSHTAYLMPDHGMQCVLVDTVGFISQLDHSLFDSFTASLEEVRHSDVILHVIDRSHPDWRNQKQVVQSTLQALHLPEKISKSMITVYNKVDLLSEDSHQELDGDLSLDENEDVSLEGNRELPLVDVGEISLDENEDVSLEGNGELPFDNNQDMLLEEDDSSEPIRTVATTSAGLDELRARITQSLMDCGFYTRITITVPDYGDQYLFLHDNCAAITREQFSDEGVAMEAVIPSVLLSQFCSKFPANPVCRQLKPEGDDPFW